jgi:uncharacterized membrane protein YfcA
MLFFAEVLGFSIFAGMVGSLLGIGGGVVLIPFLTLVMGIKLHYAIGASIVSVIATSSGAGAAYLRDRLVNFRLGLFLNIATVAGAVCGTLITGFVSARFLGAILGVVLFYSGLLMLRSKDPGLPEATPPEALPEATLPEAEPERTGGADRFRLDSSYFDPVARREIPYRVHHVGPSMAMLYVAGVISGMLGIGSGAFKVLVMDTMMKLPIKVSTTTSNFMVGLNAAASAGMYFSRGDIHPSLAAPVALGILGGTLVGTRMLMAISGPLLRRLFFVILIVSAVQMLWKAYSGTIS